MKISSRSWVTAMVSGECKSLTPRGEEIALAEVTATTEGVVVTVTMATGTLEDFVFPGNETPENRVTGGTKPDGISVTQAAITLVLSASVAAFDSPVR